MYEIKKHNLNFHNLGHLKWTGTFWVVSRNTCANIDPDGWYLENKIHNCDNQGHPVQLVPRTDQSYTVTDEKLAEMKEDGRLDYLLESGVNVKGGADPLYFEWHSEIADIYDSLGTRTNNAYSQMYPYLELYTLDDVMIDLSLSTALNYLAQIGNQFYTGDYLAKKHEATLRFINNTTDLPLLYMARELYINSLTDMKQANDNPTQQAIENAFIRGLELAGSNPIVSAISFGFERIQRLVRVMYNIAEQELNAINKRISKLLFGKADLEFGGDKVIPQKKQNNKQKSFGDKLVKPVIGTLAILNILSFFR